jgi:signal transduction histidine kinase
MARVFDPYFTTRRTGTGLGLAISRNIVEGLRGTISIGSRSGEGTTVHIELPVQ